MDVLSEKMKVSQYSFKILGLGDGSGQFTALMLNPLQFSGSNNYSTQGEMIRDAPLLSTAFMGVVGAKIEDFSTKHGQRMLGGYGKFSKSESRAKWTDSSKPQFAVVFRLLANTADDAETNMAIVKLINSATLPIEHKGLFLAPLGYKGAADGEGTLTFALGTWFLASKLIMVSQSCQPSTQLMRNGYPLTWDCTLTMEPHESITIDEFERYFQQPTIIQERCNRKLGSQCFG